MRRKKQEAARVREGGELGGAPSARPCATCSQWRGPQRRRYDLEALEDHIGAGGRCEEERVAERNHYILTSTTHSPSEGGGRGVGSEGVRLSLGKETREEDVLVLLSFLMLQNYFNWQ